MIPTAKQQRQMQALPGTPVVGFPINRRRQPMAQRTEVSPEEHAKRQKAAAEARITAEDAAKHPMVDTQLTTVEHVGKVPNEPHAKNTVNTTAAAPEGADPAEEQERIDAAIEAAEERTAKAEAEAEEAAAEAAEEPNDKSPTVKTPAKKKK
jgi:hypothetical protein